MPISYFQCSQCGQKFEPEKVTYICPTCGGNLDTHFSFEENPSEIDQAEILRKTEKSIWRYAALLPVPDPGFKATPLHQVGFTPIYQPENLRQKLGLRNLFVKDESGNPSASFKDRASAIVVSRAIEADIETIITASTGNAGAAMACMAASVGKRAIVLAPRTAPPAKIAQLLTYGSQVVLIDGSYDDATELSIAASNEFGWYNRNTGYNPYTVEGKKTAGLEIWEQFLRFQPADDDLNVFVSVGDGNILSGIAKGFLDLLAVGWIERLPRLIGVQSEGSAAVYNAFVQNSNHIEPVKADTVADSISVNLPADGLRALKRVRESNGFMLSVSDEQILSAIPQLGSAGIFVEPAAAAAYAGLIRALETKQIDPATPALVLATGSGLKDVKAAMRAVSPAPIIEPNLQKLKEVLGA
ncbi:MAG: threonine synthase [Anaerolineaceae bacterium]|jgi:threonine synthase|nr:threonine synthase [Anaerolineaceae bacterium]MDD4042299.1 threonine synthase [Anaerolineaceae bacterium]MDD4578284.1 threonine synthase [Anaerolineaceae bacterium]